MCWQYLKWQTSNLVISSRIIRADEGMSFRALSNLSISVISVSSEDKSIFDQGFIFSRNYQVRNFISSRASILHNLLVVPDPYWLSIQNIFRQEKSKNKNEIQCPRIMFPNECIINDGYSFFDLYLIYPSNNP